MTTAVKVCGVTDPASAVLSARLGAAYLGLNFWPRSPRHLDLGAAREIAAAVRAVAPRTALVGVFVHPTAAEIDAADRAAGLDLLQFSGDEPPAEVAPHAARAIKALRLAPAADPLAGFADCWGVLFDTPRQGGRVGGGGALDYGGTGRAWDHAAVGAALGDLSRRRIFLAGGIRPANVRGVVERLSPFAVDVCSGVESAPGRKDERLLRQLFEEVHHAQATTAP